MASEEPGFLVDEMLQRLGRWLRAAGYDTRIATHAEADYYLLRQAIDEGRLLLTRNPKLLEHRRAPGTVILLSADTLEACAEELSTLLDINWQHDPFSRCLACNSLLQDATPQQREKTPPRARQLVEAAYYCPDCNQVYWEGSHVKRMRRLLEHWQHMQH